MPQLKWFLGLYGLAVKDMPVVGYEHLRLLQSHVTCMLSDECLNRISGLLKCECLHSKTTANFKESDTKTDKKTGIHGRQQEPACEIVLGGKLRNVRQRRHFRRLSIERSRHWNSKRQCVLRDCEVIRRSGVYVLVSASWLAHWHVACRLRSRMANVLTCSRSVRDASYRTAYTDSLISRRSERRCYHLSGRPAFCFSCTE